MAKKQSKKELTMVEKQGENVTPVAEKQAEPENTGVTNYAVPLQLELTCIAESLISILAEIKILNAILACGHCNVIRNGTKSCNFCDIKMQKVQEKK